MHEPTRHVVMSFVSADDASVAVLLLLHELGLGGEDVASYTRSQMRTRATVVLTRISPPASPNLESELVITQRELARRGHSFVLVRVGSNPLLKRIASIAAETHAHMVLAPPRPVSVVALQPMKSPIRPVTAARTTARWPTPGRPSATLSAVSATLSAAR